MRSPCFGRIWAIFWASTNVFCPNRLQRKRCCTLGIVSITFGPTAPLRFSLKKPSRARQTCRPTTCPSPKTARGCIAFWDRSCLSNSESLLPVGRFVFPRRGVYVVMFHRRLYQGFAHVLGEGARFPRVQYCRVERQEFLEIFVFCQVCCDKCFQTSDSKKMA